MDCRMSLWPRHHHGNSAVVVPRPLGGGLSDDAVWRLSVAYIVHRVQVENRSLGGLKLAHVTRTPLSRSRSQGGGDILWRPPAQLVMPPPLIGAGIKRCFYLMSVAYIGPKSRTERHKEDQNWHRGSPRHMCLGHRFQGQKVKVIRPLWLVVLIGQQGHTVMVTYPYAYMAYIVSPLAGLGGGIS